jgi:hypothetical protein
MNNDDKRWLMYIGQLSIQFIAEGTMAIYRADLPAHVVVGCSFLNG